MSKYYYIIDAGHGEKTVGKRSPIDSDGQQLLEYEYNHDIAKRLSDLLKNDNIRHSLTITDPSSHSDDLQFRIGYTKAVNDLVEDVIFISIHGNAGPSNGFNNNYTGIETFYNSEGEKVAKIFQKNIVKATQLRNRGIKDGEWIYVLKNANCPAILTENGFFNGADFELMLTNEFRDRVALAHYESIIEIENKLK